MTEYRDVILSAAKDLPEAGWILRSLRSLRMTSLNRMSGSRHRDARLTTMNFTVH
jgi:hypothetical protein